MKAIMLSVKPKWTAKIKSGDKTSEIRKSKPKDLKIWVYIYETIADGGLGKVIGKFWLKKVILFPRLCNNPYRNKDACISFDEIVKYGYPREELYEWEINKLEIFDKPKLLIEYGLTKAPQSWQYIEIKE